MTITGAVSGRPSRAQSSGRRSPRRFPPRSAVPGAACRTATGSRTGRSRRSTRAVRAARRRSPEGGRCAARRTGDPRLALGLDVAGDLHPLEARALSRAVVDFVESRPRTAGGDARGRRPLGRGRPPRAAGARRPRRSSATPARRNGETRLFDRRSTWGGGRRNVASVWLEPLPELEAPACSTRLLGRSAG